MRNRSVDFDLGDRPVLTVVCHIVDISLQSFVQPLIKGTAERRLYLLAKGSRVRGGGVSVEIRLRIPDGEDHVVVRAVLLAHNLETDASRVLAAVRSELPEECICGTQSGRRRDHVDDGHDVDALRGGRLLSVADGKREKEHQRYQQSAFDHSWILQANGQAMPGDDERNFVGD